MKRRLQHLALFASLVCLCGCSLLQQDQPTVVRVQPDGVVLVEAEGYRLGDQTLRAQVDERGVVRASFGSDKSEFHKTIRSLSREAREAYVADLRREYPELFVR